MKITPLFSTTDHHPVMITPESDSSLAALHEFIAAGAGEISELLARHGGVLFRGFGINGAEDFRDCTERLGAKTFDYIGGNSPRTRVAAGVYTSTEYPSSEAISLHNEMSYLPSWPSRLFFFSAVPAVSGGQTSLASSIDVLQAVPAEIVQEFRERKISYIRNLQSSIPLGKNWQATYQTQDRGEVEAIAATQGSTCQWQADGSLRVSTVCEALTMHPQQGEVWFNQAEQWHPSALNPALRQMFEQMVGKGNLPHECEYGDGGPIADEALAEIRRALDRSKLLFDWQRNDLLMIDNLLMMHGRESFKGDRKTLAYLSAT